MVDKYYKRGYSKAHVKAVADTHLRTATLLRDMLADLCDTIDQEGWVSLPAVMTDSLLRRGYSVDEMAEARSWCELFIPVALNEARGTVGDQFDTEDAAPISPVIQAVYELLGKHVDGTDTVTGWRIIK